MLKSAKAHQGLYRVDEDDDDDDITKVMEDSLHWEGTVSIANALNKGLHEILD